VPDIRKDGRIQMIEETTSDSENEGEIYQPIFVKRIQSYPIFLNDTLSEVESVFNYRFSYWKIFNSTSLK